MDEFKSDGVGLDDFLKNKGGEGINSEIETQLEVCISDYTKYNLALSDAVLNNKSKVAKTIDELQKYFDQPNKTYKDYPNQEILFDFGAKTLKFFGIEKSIKR